MATACSVDSIIGVRNGRPFNYSQGKNFWNSRLVEMQLPYSGVARSTGATPVRIDPSRSIVYSAVKSENKTRYVDNAKFDELGTPPAKNLARLPVGGDGE